MGRLDRATRYYLADMLIGFLSGDYRRVAEVHFDAGYVPRRPLDRRVHAGLPFDRRADPRSAAARDFDRQTAGATLSGHRAVRDGDAAATAAAAKDDDAGRRHRPAARSERQHLDLGAPDGRAVDAGKPRPGGAVAAQIDTLLEAMQDVPRLLRGLDQLVADWSRDGVKLHAESIAEQALPLGAPAAASGSRYGSAAWPWWRSRWRLFSTESAAGGDRCTANAVISRFEGFAARGPRPAPARLFATELPEALSTDPLYRDHGVVGTIVIDEVASQSVGRAGPPTGPGAVLHPLADRSWL